MNNKLISVIVVLILIIGGFLLFKNKTIAPTEVGEKGVSNMMPVIGETGVEEMIVEEMMEGGMMPGSQTTVKEFSIGAAPFSFSPSTMTVNRGDTVKITLKNVNGTHDLKIDGFNVATRVLQAGEEQTITFVANKSGTFEYYCSVGNHRAMGMTGTFTIK